MKLASPPKGEIALGVSAKTSLALPKSEVISVRVVLCKVGEGDLIINPYAINPSHLATLFSISEFGFRSGLVGFNFLFIGHPEAGQRSR